MMTYIIYALVGYAVYYVVARSLYLTYCWFAERAYRVKWLFTLTKEERIHRLKAIRNLEAMKIE